MNTHVFEVRHTVHQLSARDSKARAASRKSVDLEVKKKSP